MWVDMYSVIIGTSGDDTIDRLDGFSFYSLAATIYGNGGNDTIHGDSGEGDMADGDGNNTIHGGDGNDDIYGGNGHDSIQGGLGNDFIHGGLGNDFIQGNDGNDTIHGNSGSDNIYGNGGNDFIHGGLGDDYISGGTGNDILTGSLGSDVFAYGNILDGYSHDHDTITDFSITEDTIQLTGMFNFNAVGEISDFIKIFNNSYYNYSVIEIYRDGSGSGADMSITLEGYTYLNLDTMINDGIILIA